jgi:hypothetical protein
VNLKEQVKTGFTLLRPLQFSFNSECSWDMSWCDPCAADPPSTEELKVAGVSWLPEQRVTPGAVSPGVPAPIMRRPMGNTAGGAQQAMVTRLHVRYSAETIPEDLMFQETKDRQNYPARYVLRQAWNGDENKCEQAKPYFEQLVQRQEREAQTLSNLTRWDINEIRQRASLKTSALIGNVRARAALWK